MTDGKVLSVGEVAQILKTTKTLVYRLLKKGELKGFRLGKNGSLRIKETELTAFQRRWRV